MQGKPSPSFSADLTTYFPNPSALLTLIVLALNSAIVSDISACPGGPRQSTCLY